MRNLSPRWLYESEYRVSEEMLVLLFLSIFCFYDWVLQICQFIDSLTRSFCVNRLWIVHLLYFKPCLPFSSVQGNLKDEIRVPGSVVQYLAGETLGRLQSQTGCHVQIPPPGPDPNAERSITLSGRLLLSSHRSMTLKTVFTGIMITHECYLKHPIVCR